MLTKEELDAIIRRRSSEGKSLSIDKIDGEAYSRWQIRDAARKIYGTWANARRSNGVESKYSRKPEMTKEEVINELKRLQETGHSMRSTEFEPWFYRRIVRHFGGYKQAKQELRVSVGRKGKSGITKRNINEVISELKQESINIKNKSIYNTEYRHLADYSRRHYGNAYEIYRMAGIEIPPNAPRKRLKRLWTDERIESSLKKAVKEFNTTSSAEMTRKGYGGLVAAIKNRFGTWNKGLVELGYEITHEYKNTDDNLSKSEAKSIILEALASGVKPLRQELEKIEGIGTAIKNIFGDISGLKKACGFCAVWDRPVKNNNTYRPCLQNKSGIVREITRLWYIDVPLNYSFIKEVRGHLIDSSVKVIGSWREAVELAGINYDEIAVTTNVLSECGSEFENIFANILTELGYEYIREGKEAKEVLDGFNLEPDFILPNWRWIDCKLSEWTDIRETLIRYYDESPNGVTIVYLRGKNRRRMRGRKRRYEHISVYQFTKLLPDDRRRYYESRLRGIEEKANENTAVS